MLLTQNQNSNCGTFGPSSILRCDGVVSGVGADTLGDENFAAIGCDCNGDVRRHFSIVLLPADGGCWHTPDAGTEGDVSAQHSQVISCHVGIQQKLWSLCGWRTQNIHGVNETHATVNGHVGPEQKQKFNLIGFMLNNQIYIDQKSLTTKL